MGSGAFPLGGLPFNDIERCLDGIEGISEREIISMLMARTREHDALVPILERAACRATAF